MSGSLNKATLIGNVGSDPDIRSMSSGGKVATFSVATSETWKDKAGERQERTEWHRVVVFQEGLVGVVESYVRKGSKLYVEGKLQTRKWTDNAGVERYSTEVVLNGFGSQLLLLTPKDRAPAPDPSAYGAESRGPGRPSASAPGALAPLDLDDEVPF